MNNFPTPLPAPLPCFRTLLLLLPYISHDMFPQVFSLNSAVYRNCLRMFSVFLQPYPNRTHPSRSCLSHYCCTNYHQVRLKNLHSQHSCALSFPQHVLPLEKSPLLWLLSRNPSARMYNNFSECRQHPPRLPFSMP